MFLADFLMRNYRQSADAADNFIFAIHKITERMRFHICPFLSEKTDERYNPLDPFNDNISFYISHNYWGAPRGNFTTYYAPQNKTRELQVWRGF